MRDGEEHEDWGREDWTGLRAVIARAQLRSLSEPRAELAVAGAFSMGAIVVAVVLIGIWTWAFAGLPRVPDANSLWSVNRPAGVTFVAADGQTLAVRGPSFGRAVTLEELPPHVPQAFLAVEDARFFDHRGVDRQALLRAAAANLTSGRTVQGGSTITQQLVKNLFLTSDRTLRRKVQEMVLATRIERMLTKAEILELYLNRVELGERAFGVDAAAQRYFGKPAAQLTLAEAAMLGGLPKAPYRDAPTENFSGAKGRQAIVLQAMESAGFITAQDHARAKAEVIRLAPGAAPEGDLGYALDLALEEARRIAGDDVRDIVTFVTIDRALQVTAQDVLRRGLSQASGKDRPLQGAIVAVDRSGAVRALVGGAGYAQSKFNRATQARRQPGSTFKAFVYAAALESGALTPDTIRYDEPIEIRGWKPKNYGESFRGAVTLRTAFAQSLNTVAVAIGQEVGPQRIADLAQRFGIRSELDPVPSLALGSEEVTLLEMTGAFSTFMREGQRVDPFLVTRIEDSRGRVLFQRPVSQPRQVYPQAQARKMTGMLARVLQNGTGVRAALPGRDAAGKTGTSQDWRDAWFVGYTADITAGVWMGYDDYTPMPEITGGNAPAEIWHAFVAIAYNGKPATKLKGIEPVIEPSTRQVEVASFYEGLTAAFGAETAEDPAEEPVEEDSPYLQ